MSGRLMLEEFSGRVDQAYAARVRADLSCPLIVLAEILLRGGLMGVQWRCGR